MDAPRAAGVQGMDTNGGTLEPGRPFILFLVFLAAAATFVLLDAWLPIERFGIFPLSYGLRLSYALSLWALSGAAFFALRTLAGAQGGPRRPWAPTFLLTFLPTFAYAGLVVGRVAFAALRRFVLCAQALSWLSLLAFALYALLRRKDSRRLYVYIFGAGQYPSSPGRHPPPSDLAGSLTAEAVARFRLSPREAEVASLILAGMTNGEIADRLCISLSTVKTHLAKIFEKTGARNRIEVAIRCSASPHPKV